jgi:hypothetical protein
MWEASPTTLAWLMYCVLACPCRSQQELPLRAHVQVGAFGCRMQGLSQAVSNAATCPCPCTAHIRLPLPLPGRCHTCTHAYHAMMLQQHTLTVSSTQHVAHAGPFSEFSCPSLPLPPLHLPPCYPPFPAPAQLLLVLMGP